MNGLGAHRRHCEQGKLKIGQRCTPVVVGADPAALMSTLPMSPPATSSAQFQAAAAAVPAGLDAYDAGSDFQLNEFESIARADPNALPELDPAYALMLQSELFGDQSLMDVDFDDSVLLTKNPEESQSVVNVPC
eukprot:TRINITY_DN1573_c0_g1_i6.p2 TRINITY_DN1573_c0_g1~~TRINITY_DN1573_c0_g1_i6.p2  ORF type:complete len:134 (+),score=30.58 TRINITY_DN1573_c0_g1_i6:115-516(+)